MTSPLIQKEGVSVEGKQYERFAIQTHFVQCGEDFYNLINTYVVPHYKEGDLLYIAEKILSISQNRVIQKKNVKLGFWAKFLSKFVMKTPAGFSVGNVYKMQVAIDLAGLPRVLFAAFCSAVTKPFGKKGVFYQVVGHEVNGLDGFYGGAFKEYEEIGILNPKDPHLVLNEIYKRFNVNAVVVDSNDLGCTVLGKPNHLNLSDEKIIALIKGNPAGQKDQKTPFILVRPK